MIQCKGLTSKNTRCKRKIEKYKDLCWQHLNKKDIVKTVVSVIYGDPIFDIEILYMIFSQCDLPTRVYLLMACGKRLLNYFNTYGEGSIYKDILTKVDRLNETYYILLNKQTSVLLQPEIRHGLYTHYGCNGLKSVEGCYKNGKKDGCWKSYFLDNKYYHSSFYIDGECVSRSKYLNLKKSSKGICTRKSSRIKAL